MTAQKKTRVRKGVHVLISDFDRDLLVSFGANNLSRGVERVVDLVPVTISQLYQLIPIVKPRNLTRSSDYHLTLLPSTIDALKQLGEESVSSGLHRACKAVRRRKQL